MLFNAPTGQTITKEMDLWYYRSGSMVMKRMEASEYGIHPIGDTAMVVVTMDFFAYYEG